MYVFQIRGFFRLETSLDIINSYLAPRLAGKEKRYKQTNKEISFRFRDEIWTAPRMNWNKTDDRPFDQAISELP